MRRREFIAGLDSAGGWSLVARAQRALPVIGYLDSSPIETSGRPLIAFRQGLSEIGYVEGRNVAIEYRSAAGQYERLPTLADELVRQRVALIAATGVSLSPLAAKAATTMIPIVFAIGGDPVRLSLVPSLNKPGGNFTGVTFLSNELGAVPGRPVPRAEARGCRRGGFLSLRPGHRSLRPAFGQIRADASRRRPTQPRSDDRFRKRVSVMPGASVAFSAT